MRQVAGAEEMTITQEVIEHAKQLALYHIQADWPVSVSSVTNWLEDQDKNLIYASHADAKELANHAIDALEKEGKIEKYDDETPVCYMPA